MKRAALFAHFDHQNEVKPYILYFLKCLRELCGDIIFVSTSPLPPSEFDKLQHLVSRIELRENSGFDFGMWHHALGLIDLSQYDEIVLTNSSIFGPVFPLSPIFERMQHDPCDFWGMTDSFEIRWHLQSYFLVLKSAVLRSTALTRFFDAVLPYRDKFQLIRSYEVGMALYLSENGLRPAACVPTGSWCESNSQQKRIRKGRQNPTLLYPIQLLQSGMPFVKAQLLRDNPKRIALKPVWRAVEATGYDVSLIEFDRKPDVSHGFGNWLRGGRQVQQDEIDAEIPKL